MNNSVIKSILIFIMIIAIATIINSIFDSFGVHDSNLIMVYILAVILIAVFTEGYFLTLLGPLTVVLLFNFFFTEPRLTFSTYDTQYPLTLLIMLIISLIATILTTRLKKEILLSKQVTEEKQKVEMQAHSENLKSNILKSISHDVRTPLTSIIGCIETVLENDSLSEDVKRQLLIDAYDDTTWMIRLIENILNVTKIQDGRLNLSLNEETIDDIISEAVKRTKKIIKTRKLLIELPNELVTVNVDIQLIVQVLINLIENAVNHTSKNGVISVSSLVNDTTVLIAVEDNGSGINPLDAPHIFEMFYTSVQDGSRGIGLGLSICRSIIVAHGGTIQIDESELNGAKFTFSLPLGGVHPNE